MGSADSDKIPPNADSLREERLAVCETYHDDLITLAEHIDDHEVGQVVAFLMVATCFLEPAEKGMTVIGRLEGEVGLCPLLPEDAALHPFIARHVQSDPCFSNSFRAVMIPPPHDLQRVTRTELYVHEGVHALQAARRGYGQRPEGGISGHEELRAYRMGSAVVAALCPEAYPPSIDRIKENIRARSSFPHNVRDGLELAWDNVALGAVLLDQPEFNDRDRAYLRTTLKFSAMDELLSEQYPDEPAIEQVKADFIRRTYDEHEAGNA